MLKIITLTLILLCMSLATRGQAAADSTLLELATADTETSAAETKKLEAESRQPPRAGEQRILGKIEFLDAKKNYVILIDKEGKLFTFDFTRSMTATELLPAGTRQVPVHQIPRGSSADVRYRMAGDNKVLTKIEFKKTPVVDTGNDQLKGDKQMQGDIGLVDTAKNYLVLVTKEGTLVPFNFARDFTATQLTSSGPRKVSMNDLGIRSSVSIEYRTEGPKNFITKIEFREPYSQ
jgi:hypothetical protein